MKRENSQPATVVTQRAPKGSGERDQWLARTGLRRLPQVIIKLASRTNQAQGKVFRLRGRHHEDISIAIEAIEQTEQLVIAKR